MASVVASSVEALVAQYTAVDTWVMEVPPDSFWVTNLVCGYRDFRFVPGWYLDQRVLPVAEVWVLPQENS